MHAFFAFFLLFVQLIEHTSNFSAQNFFSTTCFVIDSNRTEWNTIQGIVMLVIPNQPWTI